MIGRDRKYIPLILALVCMLGLAGCTSNTDRATEPDSAISACIGNDVTSVKITHVLSGQSRNGASRVTRLSPCRRGSMDWSTKSLNLKKETHREIRRVERHIALS